MDFRNIKSCTIIAGNGFNENSLRIKILYRAVFVFRFIQRANPNMLDS